MHRVCKVCLSCNVRMYSIKDSKLYKLYEKLTNTEVINTDSNAIVCYICYSQLLRSHKFSELARKSQIILRSFANCGVEISQDTILKLNLGTKHNISITNIPPISIVGLNVEYTQVTVKTELLEIEKETVDDKIKKDDLSKQAAVQTQKKKTKLTLDKSGVNLKNKVKIKNTKVLNTSVRNAKKPPASRVPKTCEPKVNSQLLFTPDNCNITCGKEEQIDSKQTNNLKTAKINETLRNLEDLIAKSKPDIIANYNIACQKIREHNKKNGKPLKRLPKRRFPWCNRSRALLASLVELASPEHASDVLLKRALPLFPKGFARMPTLLRMADCNLTNSKKKTEIKPQNFDSAPLTPLEPDTQKLPWEPNSKTSLLFSDQIEVPKSLSTSDKVSPGDNKILLLPYITNTFSLKTDACPVTEESKKLRNSLRLANKGLLPLE